jgi:hypothetical protein
VKTLLALAALGEALTGFILIVNPAVVVRLLFGSNIADAGIIVSRIAGIGLLSLGIACSPRAAPRSAFYGMLCYSGIASLYLLFIVTTSRFVGVLLWPAIFAHIVLTVLLAIVGFKQLRIRNGI